MIRAPLMDCPMHTKCQHGYGVLAKLTSHDDSKDIFARQGF